MTRGALVTLAAVLAGLLAWTWFGWQGADRRAEGVRQHMAAERGRFRLDSALRADSLEQLRARLAALRADSADLARQLEIATRDAQAAADSLAVLTAGLSDSLRDAIAAQVHTIAAVGVACQATLENCEERAANAEARERQEAAAAAAARRLAAVADSSWQDAEQRARPNLFRDLWRTKQVWATVLAVVTVVVVVR